MLRRSNTAVAQLHGASAGCPKHTQHTATFANSEDVRDGRTRAVHSERIDCKG